jgi:hypothetical protein
MKKPSKYLMLTMLVVSLFAVGFVGRVFAATTVGLGTAASFAVLAGTGITNVPTSVITGDVGLSPASGSNYSGLTAAEVSGLIYAVDGSGPAGSVNNPALLTTAKNDLTTAYLDAAGRTPNTTFVAADNQLGGKTLTAGTYAFGHASTANLTAASPLVLDGQGDPNATFIFQASSDLVTASSSVVQLVNGAQACNVFWQVGSSTTLGTSSTFKGTIMSLTASTITTGANIEGRILARNAAVTLDSNTITRPTCIAPATTTSSGGSGATTPTLPNAGLAPANTSSTPWIIVVPASLTVLIGSLYIARKKRLI